MKKMVTLIASLGLSAAIYALPVLNPAEPALLTSGAFFCDDGDCWGLKFGYRGDFVFNRNLRDSSAERIRQFSQFANEGVLTLNLWNRLDIYGFVGSVNNYYENVQYNQAIPTPTLVYITAASRARTIWGVGAKAVLWEACFGNSGTTYVGLDVQYEGYGAAPYDRATIQGANAATNGVGYKYREWQIALGIAHRVKNLVPYWAIKWSNVRGDVGVNNIIGSGSTTSQVPLHDFKIHRKPVGMAFGVTLVDVGRMDVTGEARLVDEKALSVAANIRF